MSELRVGEVLGGAVSGVFGFKRDVPGLTGVQGVLVGPLEGVSGTLNTCESLDLGLLFFCSTA